MTKFKILQIHMLNVPRTPAGLGCWTCVRLITKRAAHHLRMTSHPPTLSRLSKAAPLNFYPKRFHQHSRRADGGHSGQFLWFYQSLHGRLEENPRSSSPLCEYELVHFWQKLYQAAQSRRSQAGSQTREWQNFLNQTVCTDSGSCFGSQKIQKRNRLTM